MLVTGASGFIGGHLCHALAKQEPATVLWGLDLPHRVAGHRYTSLGVDLCDARALAAALSGVDSACTIHLAAKAEVLVPLSDCDRLFECNLKATVNLLELLQPGLLIFASSSAVYGNTLPHGDNVNWSNLNPRGLYGGTKMLGEMLCAQWAAETGGHAISFRFGNVIGPGCRGLLPHLVEHALADPEGRLPVQLRGGGKLVRDYIPVEHVIGVMLAASQSATEAQRSEHYNIGSGEGMTNREVTTIAAAALARQGYRLNPVFENPRAAGEAETTVLPSGETSRRFGLAPPDHDAVIASIEDAVMFYLQQGQRNVDR